MTARRCWLTQPPWRDPLPCALNNIAFASVDVNNTDSSQQGWDLRPRISNLVFGHPRQQKRQPTEENMGPDPIEDAVVHQPQIKRGFGSAEGVLDS